MLDSFTAQTFAPYRGQSFRVDIGADAPVDLRLSEVAEADQRFRSGPRSSPFSLVFHGPLEIRLVQRTYEVEHDVIGRFPLFLVPIEPDALGPRYEAVFN